MAVSTLTTRDREILEIITGPCRFLSVPQISRTFWPSSKVPMSDARKRLVALKDAGLIETRIIMAHPELDLHGPLFSYPGGDPSDLGKVAHRAKVRWTDSLQATRVVVATLEARELLGARPGRETRRSETTHDLHLAQVYLAYRRRDPELASRWVSGDNVTIDVTTTDVTTIDLKTINFEKTPDAVIRDDQGRITRVVDFAGSYSAGKLKAMHREYREFPYELW